MAQTNYPQNQDSNKEYPNNRAPQNYGIPGQFPPNFNPQQPHGAIPPQPQPKKKKNNKNGSLSIFALVGLAIGIFLTKVNQYVKAMTVIDLPGAPVIR